MAVSLTSTGITFADGTSTTTTLLIPVGTNMLFVQTSAPTGWTKSITNNDTTLRVVSGAASSGGSLAFSSAFASRSISGSVNATTLTRHQIPAHRHSFGNGQGFQPSESVDDYNYSTPGAGDSGFGGGRSWGLEYIGATGGSESHTHGFTGTNVDFAVQYVDTIFATKN